MRRGAGGGGEPDLGETCAQGWSKKNGIMTTSSKEVSPAEVTSGTAAESSFSSPDCYFESNTVGEKKRKVILSQPVVQNTPPRVTSMTMGRPLLAEARHYKRELTL